MKILVFSDTHGRINKCIKVIQSISEVDLIIHLGDVIQDVYDLQQIFPNIQLEYVLGNNDFFSKGPKEKILQLNNKKIYMTHGHIYRVKTEYDKIVNKALNLDADLLLFGHTHVPYKDIRKNMQILNPGSISIPNYGRPTYGIVEIANNIIDIGIYEAN